MIVELFISIINQLIIWISYILPSYSSFPIPDKIDLALQNIVLYARAVVSFPILRVIVPDFITYFLPIWFIIWQWNFFIKVISSIPLFKGIANWKMKDKENE